MPDKYEELFEGVREWALAIYGHRAVSITVELDTGKSVTTPIPALRSKDRAGKHVTHSPDYRKVQWYGIELVFTSKQAIVFGILYQAFESGAFDVAQQYLLNACKSDCTRLGDLFRRHEAWGDVIVPGELPGTYRLIKPADTGD